MKSRFNWPGAIALLLLSVSHGSSFADHGSNSGQSFLTLQPGFTQEIVGVSPSFLGGVAFAPDGDPMVNNCSFFGSPLHRFDLQSAPVAVNGTPLHSRTTVASNAGCGLTNHPNGSLYSNTSSGVVKLDANLGTMLAGPGGPAGNALGITVDPQTGTIVYVGSNSTLLSIDPGLTTPGTFSTVTTGNFLDGIYFDPTGNFLFVANRSPSFRVTILRRDGSLVQHVPMTSEPDGIAFKSTAPKFVVSSNIDGTMTRFDFPSDDFTQVPVITAFATGGFRGDLSQVGADGCLYLTQDGTRYNNGTVSGENSLVRVCPGFAPPAGVGPGPGPGPGPIKTLPENLACSSGGITALLLPEIIGAAHRTILVSLLGIVDRYRDTPFKSLSLSALDSVIVRVDGCALRSTPDTVFTHGGAGMDYVTSCPSQAPIYACLKDARAQLIGP